MSDVSPHNPEILKFFRQLQGLRPHSHRNRYGPQCNRFIAPPATPPNTRDLGNAMACNVCNVNPALRRQGSAPEWRKL